MTTSTTPRPPSTASIPTTSLGPVQARFALASGVLGLVANTLFVAFWLITYPYWFDLTWGWLGPASDSVGIGMLLTLIPVVFGVRGLLPRSRAVAALSVLAALALASMAILQLAGTQGWLDWGVQVRIVVALLVPVYGWLIAVNSLAHRAEALPRTVTRLGLVLGVLWPAGLLLMLAGLLLGGSDPAYLEFGLPGGLLMAPGMLLGTLGWLALPVWPLLLGRAALRRHRVRRQPASDSVVLTAADTPSHR
ncbi:MAG TPA: hypothetical protein VIT41_05370 [Microlunatus sp.]